MTRWRKVVARLSAVLAAAVLAVSCGTLAATEPRLAVSVGTASGDLAEFSPPQIEAPAKTDVRLSFTNSSTLDHNLVFVGPIAARTTDIVAPGASEAIDFTTPGAGTYRFVCTIHEGMDGSLIVR